MFSPNTRATLQQIKDEKTQQKKINRRKTTFAPKTLFNIEEIDNETTGNNVRINLAQVNNN